MNRAVIWAEGKFSPQGAKTAVGIVRLGRRFQVVAIVDSTRAGRDAGEVLGDAPSGIPVVDGLAAAMDQSPDTFILGFAPFECTRVVEPSILAAVREALDRGLHVVSSLHCLLGDDRDLARRAAERGVDIWDVRRSPPARLWDGSVLGVEAMICLTCGNDCSVGKMTAALQLHRSAQSRGVDAGFVATGQTGILIGCDAGVVVDHVAGDFMSGAVEEAVAVSASRGREMIFVEGNGALTHPTYGGVTLGIVQGCAPDYVVLCWEEGRARRKFWDDLPVDPPRTEWEFIRWANRGLRPPRLGGLCVQTARLDEAAARSRLAALEDDWGVPATDALRFGVDRLVDYMIADWRRRPRQSSGGGGEMP